MADVIDFASHRKQQEKPTLEQLAERCSEEISSNWQRFARNNRLNDYFVSSTPSWSQPNVDYLSDITALSVIENKIKLTLTLHAPSAQGESQVGWVASFKINGARIETPQMFSEGYARCFNILLFLKLGRELTQLGIPLN